jgi:hypothetical protein
MKKENFANRGIVFLMFSIYGAQSYALLLRHLGDDICGREA